MTPAQAQDLLDTYRRALQSLDVDLALSLYREEAELRDDPWGPTCVGVLAIRARWNALAATRAHIDFDIERHWTSGSAVIAAWHGAYTVRASAARVRQRAVTIFELDAGGLILRERTWALERSVGLDSTWTPEPEEPEDGSA